MREKLRNLGCALVYYLLLYGIVALLIAWTLVCALQIGLPPVHMDNY